MGVQDAFYKEGIIWDFKTLMGNKYSLWRSLHKRHKQVTQEDQPRADGARSRESTSQLKTLGWKSIDKARSTLFIKGV